MVKKLIEGLLKKKGKEEKKKEADSNTSEEDVPDELPPLAEDIVSKPDDSKESSSEEKEESNEENSEDSNVPEELPDELPSLDSSKEDTKTEEKKADSEDKSTEKEEEKPSEKAESEKKKEEQPIQEKTSEEPNKEEEQAQEKQSSFEELKKETGFFANILEHVKKHDGSKDKLLSGDLFSRMSNYWDIKKHEVSSGKPLPTENKLEEDLKNKLENLKILEEKWQVQKLALEQDIKFLHEREIEIQNKVQELRKISNELNLFKNVKPEEYFCLYNGVVLKNLHDLIDILEVIDDETFKHHVRKDRNDFSNWIEHVIKDKNLASKIKKAKSKEEMIEIIESEPVITESLKTKYVKEVPPKKYFWLSNGVVIRSIQELCDAIKTMNDELFSKHVNENRNDFSDWIKNRLKMDELGGKIDKAKTREDMIVVFEAYI